MTDITMCSGKYCPLKKECYRFTAPKGLMQATFLNPPYEKGIKHCNFYMKDDRRTNNRTDNR